MVNKLGTYHFLLFQILKTLKTTSIRFTDPTQSSMSDRRRPEGICIFEALLSQEAMSIHW